MRGRQPQPMERSMDCTKIEEMEVDDVMSLPAIAWDKNHAAKQVYADAGAHSAQFPEKQFEIQTGPGYATRLVRIR